MGYYVNPRDVSKEEWLKRNGMYCNGVPTWSEVLEGFLPVCLVDNGPFKAAGICYNESELKEFSSPLDGRPKKWYMVDMKRLFEICPVLIEVMEREGVK